MWPFQSYRNKPRSIRIIGQVQFQKMNQRVGHNLSVWVTQLIAIRRGNAVSFIITIYIPCSITFFMYTLCSLHTHYSQSHLVHYLNNFVLWVIAVYHSHIDRKKKIRFAPTAIHFISATFRSTGMWPSTR